MIHSLIINLIEKFLNNNEYTNKIKTIEHYIFKNEFSIALDITNELIKNCKLEIHDFKVQQQLLLELIFIKAILQFKLKNYDEAKVDFLKLLSSFNYNIYAILFLIQIYELEKNYNEISLYLEPYLDFNTYKFPYFHFIHLKLKFINENFSDLIVESQKLIDFLSTQKQITILPPLNTNFINAKCLEKILDETFQLSNFIYNILIIAADANFNLENYELAFEYYKNASNNTFNLDLKYKCYYNMACAKIRILDFKTAKTILEQIIFSNDNINPSIINYALIDLAYLLEYHFDDIEYTIQILKKYIELNPNDLEIKLKLLTLLYNLNKFNELLFYVEQHLNTPITEEIINNNFYLELYYLAAKTYYMLNNYEQCINILKQILTFNEKIKTFDSYYEMIILISCALLLNNQLDLISNYINQLENCNIDIKIKLQIIELNQFIELYKEAPYFLYINNEQIMLFKGFILLKLINTAPSNISTIKSLIEKQNLTYPLFIIISSEIKLTDYQIICDAFNNKNFFIINEKNILIFNQLIDKITLKSNILKINKISYPLQSLIAFILLLFKINFKNIPDFNFNLNFNYDTIDHSNYAGILNFYIYFKQFTHKLLIFKKYIYINFKKQINSNNLLTQFLINFKNIDLNTNLFNETEIERIVINSSPELFLYNYFRENLNLINISNPTYFFVSSTKFEYFKLILEFIFKKLNLIEQISIIDDINYSICLKKVNNLLLNKINNELYAYHLILIIILIRLDIKTLNFILPFLNYDFILSIKFSEFECNFKTCPHNKSCNIKNILENYLNCNTKFILSSFTNYFFISNYLKTQKNTNYIFINLSEFYLCGKNYFCKLYSLKNLLNEINQLLNYFKLTNDETKKLKNLSNIINYIINYFNDFINSTSNTNLTKLLFNSLNDCTSFLNKLITNQSDNFLNLISLIKFTDIYSKFEFNYEIKFIVTQSKNIFLKIYDKTWINNIKFEENIKKVYFISEEQENGFYENQLLPVIKFFKHYNLTNKYLELSSTNANIIIQDDISSSYNELIYKILLANKKLSIFFINDEFIENLNFKQEYNNYHILSFKTNNLLNIENYFTEFDYIIINYQFKSKKHIYSILTILRNSILKFSTNPIIILASNIVYKHLNKLHIDKIKNLNYFVNEIDYFNFCKSDENLILNSDISYENITSLTLKTTVKHYLLPNHINILQIQNIFNEIYNELIFKPTKFIFESSNEKLEKTLFMFIYAFFINNLNKKLVINIENEIFKNKIIDFLSSLNLINIFDTNENKIIIKNNLDLNFDNKNYNIKNQDVILINYQCRTVLWNSSNFNIYNYLKFYKLLEFHSNISLISANFNFNIENINLLEFISNFNNYLDINYHELIIFLVPNEIIQFFYFELETSYNNLKFIILTLDNIYSLTNLILNNSNKNILLITFTFSNNDIDIKFLYSIKDMLSINNNVELKSYYFIERNTNNDTQYADIFYTKLFLEQFKNTTLQVTTQFLAIFFPLSLFSKINIERNLVLLLKNNNLNINILKEEYKNLILDFKNLLIDYNEINTLTNLKIIQCFFSPNSNQNYFLAELIDKNLIIINDEIKLLDFLFSQNKEILTLKIQLITNDNQIEILKKMLTIRKKLLQYLFDLNEFKLEKYFSFPLNTLNELTLNDFYYIRELTFLKLYNICIFTYDEKKNIMIKRIKKQIEIEKILENVEYDLKMMYNIIYDLSIKNELVNLNTISKLISITKKTYNFEPKHNEFKNYSYYLKLLFQLFMYGIINLQSNYAFESNKNMLYEIKINDKSLNINEILNLYQHFNKENI